jgi:hypothetical protein
VRCGGRDPVSPEQLHLEAAVPDSETSIEAGGFPTDNAAGKREKNSRFEARYP